MFAATPTAAAPGPTELSGDRSGRSSLGVSPLPCDLDAVLSTSCRSCHSAQPGLQAPMALVSREDLLAPSVSDSARPVYELMLQRVHDASAPMPPAPNHRLTAEDLRTLDAMQGQGPAAASSVSCSEGSAPAPQLTPPTDDELGTCYTLKAHQLSAVGDTTPHVVESGEHYSCFTFDIPWAADAQAIRIRASAGPSAHHVMLFDAQNPPAAGDVRAQQPNCAGIGLQTPLSVWIGGQPLEQDMPQNVGLQLPAPTSGHRLLLEVHYSNPGEPITDESGVEICTPKAARPQLAAVSLLATPAFSLPPGQASDVNGTCTPAPAGDIHIFRSFPHMHARGRHFNASIARFAGAEESLLDVAFDANSQHIYDFDTVVHPGDQLRLRCGYVNDTDRTISEGFGAEDEMCNHFVYAWPAGAITPVCTL